MKKLFLLLALLPALLLAQVPDPKPNTFVNDYDNILQPEQIQALNERILSMEKKSSVQVAIVLINNLPDGVNIEDYTLEIGRTWHVGKADNGLVYVAAIKDRKDRLEVANNLQGDIPDITAKQIIDNIKSYYKEGDYYGGLNELLNGIEGRVDPVAKEQLRLEEIQAEKRAEEFKAGFLSFLLWLGLAGLIFGAVWYFFLRPYYNKKREAREAEEKREWEEQVKRGNEIHKKYMESHSRRPNYNNIVIPPIISNKKSDDDDNSYKSTYTPPSNNDNNNNNDYGNFGGGSNDSGFSGGGASGGW